MSPADLFSTSLVVMISSESYHKEEADGKGSVLIASADMLPGKIFLRERPVLSIPCEDVDKYADDDAGQFSLVLAGYDSFRELQTPEEIAAVLSLFGPTTGGRTHELRDYARCCPFSDNEEEVEIFVKITNIIRLNAFHAGSYFGLFPTLTRMSHSCVPNASVTFEGNLCTCRVLLPVSAGEELTIEYSPLCRMQPTYIRRQVYAERKDFTCMCARCCAPGGDDTRQFDCSDDNCHGLHYAQQPLSEPSLYVQPYMLPCDTCGRAAPPQYQRFMFEFEEKLPAVTAYFNDKVDSVDYERSRSEAMTLVQRIESLPLPKRHVACAPLMYMILSLKCHLTTDETSKDLLRSMYEYRELYSNVARFPNDVFTIEMYRMCCLVAQVPLSASAPHLLFHVFLISSCRALIRVYMILFGREERIPRIDAILRDRLQKVTRGGDNSGSNNDDPTKCTFCMECSSQADIKLRLCGRCLRATYCSAGCQKAHWKLHKVGCKPQKAP